MKTRKEKARSYIVFFKQGQCNVNKSEDRNWFIQIGDQQKRIPAIGKTAAEEIEQLTNDYIGERIFYQETNTTQTTQPIKNIKAV